MDKAASTALLVPFALRDAFTWPLTMRHIWHPSAVAGNGGSAEKHKVMLELDWSFPGLGRERKGLPPERLCTWTAVFLPGTHQHHPTDQAWAQLAHNCVHDDHRVFLHQTLAHASHNPWQNVAEFGHGFANSGLGKEGMCEQGGQLAQRWLPLVPFQEGFPCRLQCNGTPHSGRVGVADRSRAQLLAWQTR